MRVLNTGDLPVGNFSRQLHGKDCGNPGLSLILADVEPGAAHPSTAITTPRS